MHLAKHASVVNIVCLALLLFFSLKNTLFLGLLDSMQKKQMIPQPFLIFSEISTRNIFFPQSEVEIPSSANKYKLIHKVFKETRKNILLITLLQMHDCVPKQASNGPTIHLPRDSSLWPYNNCP